MNIIKRDVFVLRDSIKSTIKYVQGTDTVPIEFKFRDFTFQEGMIANVIIRKPSGKEIYDQAIIDIANNIVLVNVTKQMAAEVGLSYLQLEIKHGDNVLYNFLEYLDVKKSLIAISSDTGSSLIDDYIKRINELVTIALNETSTKAEYATAQGDYAKLQGDYAKSQGVYAEKQGGYAKTEGTNVRSEFELLKETLAGIQNGELLLEIKDMLEAMYVWATDIDIDNIISGEYVEIDENGGFFDTATDEDIDKIIAGTFVEDEGENAEDTTDAEIQKIIDDAFKEV